MKDQRIAAIGIDQAIFGAATQSDDMRTRQALSQIDGNWLAQVGAAWLDATKLLTGKDGGEPTDRRFDFGKFWHAPS